MKYALWELPHLEPEQKIHSFEEVAAITTPGHHPNSTTQMLQKIGY